MSSASGSDSDGFEGKTDLYEGESSRRSMRSERRQWRSCSRYSRAYIHDVGAKRAERSQEELAERMDGAACCVPAGRRRNVGPREAEFARIVNRKTNSNKKFVESAHVVINCTLEYSVPTLPALIAVRDRYLFGVLQSGSIASRLPLDHDRVQDPLDVLLFLIGSVGPAIFGLRSEDDATSRPLEEDILGGCCLCGEPSLVILEADHELQGIVG